LVDAFGFATNEAKLQVNLGDMVEGLITFAGVEITKPKDTAEQLPKKVGPSIAALGTGKGWVKLKAGSVVGNIWAGMSSL
jgi:hypothetical protein